MVAVCICSHNPDPKTLGIVVTALAQQTAPPGSFHVLLVDNASSPPLGRGSVWPLLKAGVAVRIVREEKPGLARARLKAIAETEDDWVIFVDDDNQLAADYVAKAIRFAAENPGIGCFGGRLVLPSVIKPESWVEPFLPDLGVRDYGDAVITNFDQDQWGEWEPAGAGAVVHRRVLEEYQRLSETEAGFFNLGRSGNWGVASCDDSLMMRGAVRLGMGSAYVPGLELRHYINPRRFRLSYLLRLMYGYGQSFVRLDRVLYGDIPPPKDYSKFRRTWRKMKWRWRQYAGYPWQMRVGQLLSDLGRYTEFHRGNRGDAA